MYTLVLRYVVLDFATLADCLSAAVEAVGYNRSINSVLYEPELEAVLAAIDRGQDTADLGGVLTWTID